MIKPVNYRTLALILFMINPCLLYSQEPKYINYNTNHGLPSNEVYDILQDSKGYMWFATDNGVSRFNGYEFKNYNLEDGLINKNIHVIYEDYKGRIWFVHSNNNLSYYFEDSIFHYQFNHKIPYNAFPKFRKDIGFDFIQNINVNHKEDLLIQYSATGSLFIDSCGSVIKNYPRTTSLMEIYYDTSFNVLAVRRNGNDSLSDKRKKLLFENKNYSILANQWPIAQVLKFCKLSNGKFAFTNTQYTYIFKNGIILDSLALQGDRMIFMKPDSNDLWISNLGEYGMKCYKNAVLNKQPYKHYIKNHTVTDFCKLTDGSIWISTLENGIFFISNEFFLLLPDCRNETLLKLEGSENNELLAVSRDQYVYKLVKGQLKKLVDIKLLFYDWPVQYKNHTWFFTNNGTYILDKNKSIKRLTSRYIVDEDRVVPPSINSNHTIPVADNIFMFATKYGVSFLQVDFKKNNFFRKNDFPKIYNIYVNGFCKYAPNKYLTATHKGLYMITPDTVDLLQTKIQCLNKKNELFNTRIDKIIHYPSDQSFWMATKNKGILIWNPQNDSVLSLTTKDGLPDNAIISIAYKDSLIWAGTRFGLSKIKRIDKKYRITNYSIKHGLPSNQINDIVIIDSIVYLATNKGLCYFDYTKVKKNRISPPIYISKLKVNDKDTCFSKGKINLSYKQNNISIQYEGLVYKAQKNVNYKFRLLGGSDTTWNYTTSREVRFPNLQPGHYIFEVKAQNEDGVWSKAAAQASFIIKPPFWQTWWFLSLAGLLFVCAVWLIFHFRMQEIRRRDELEKARNNLQRSLSETQQKLITQQLNPHFLFNTMSAIQNLILKNQKMEAVGLLSSFARMMRQGLEYSRIEYAQIDESIEFFRNYIALKSINLKEEINTCFIIDKNFDKDRMMIPPMIIQPFIENAIIHGLSPKGENMHLTIEFGLENKRIFCKIEDNGIGRDKSSKIKKEKEEHHKSFGISIVNETLGMMSTLHNDNFSLEYTDLHNKEGMASGTRVVVTFPIQIKDA